MRAYFVQECLLVASAGLIMAAPPALADGHAPAPVHRVVGEADEGLPDAFGAWTFLVGEWDLETKRYSFEGEVQETESGLAAFSIAPSGVHLLEVENTVLGGNHVQALHVFAVDPEHGTIEIARSDSGHGYHLSILTGTISGDQIELLEKHPNPTHSVIRRVIYTRENDDRFTRELQFSSDQGDTWFTRFEGVYTRRQ